METAVFGSLLFIFGIVIGSFLNVVILRLPKGITLTGRSYCPHCHRTLTSLELIPVVSYIWLHGKCRACSKKISPRYIILELTAGVLFLFVGLFLGYPTGIGEVLELVRFLVIVSMAIVVFVVDFEHFLILDKVTFPISVVLLLLLLAQDLITFSSNFLSGATISGIYGLLAGLVFFGAIWFFSKGKWMGFGDVKFMIPFGLSLGYPYALVGIIFAFLLGSVVSLPLVLLGNKKLQSRIPFGTFLAASLILSLFYADTLLNWYLGLIGF